MKKFEIQEKVLTIETRCFEVEANSKEEAEEKYCSELAGSINPVNQYYEDHHDGFEETTIAVEIK